MILNKVDIQNLEQRYRGTFINSLVGFKAVVLVGTKNSLGGTNLAIFNSLTHIGANPALWALVFRPATVERHTLNNIYHTKNYTINFVNAVHYQKAHQTSAKYPLAMSEFDAVGFTPQYIANHNAPFVQEAEIKIGLQFEEAIDIKVNGTILVIGSINYIELQNDLVSHDGFVALEKANILACTGLDAYYNTNFINRLTYAKHNTWPKII